MFSNDEILSIVPIIKEGGVILYPTDTVWGIGCDPFNSNAVDKIFDIKQRDREKSFVLLVSSQDMLKQYIPNIEPKLQNLLDYHVRPVTVVYDNPQNLPDYLLENDGSIAIRVTQDDFCQRLITELGIPLVSTSANITNEQTPKIFKDISTNVIQQMDYVVRYRQNEKRPNELSVMVRLASKDELIFLRE